MRRTLIAVAMAVLVGSVVLAQSGTSKKKQSHNPGPIIVHSINRPTKVKGQGMSMPSGVKYWDIQTGEGDAATKGHAVKVLYKAWLESGKEFASSITDGKPTIFTLGVGQVISGWEEGMEGMKVGGKRQLRIPPELAYGAEGVPPLIPPNATLVYDVELIELQ